MAVKLGQITKVEVNDDVALMLQMDWGEYMKLVADVDALPDDDPKTLQQLGVLVCPFIHTIKGVVDAQDKELKAMTPEVLKTFPPPLARALIKAVLESGKGSGGVVPPEEGSDS